MVTSRYTKRTATALAAAAAATARVGLAPTASAEQPDGMTCDTSSDEVFQACWDDFAAVSDFASTGNKKTGVAECTRLADPFARPGASGNPQVKRPGTHPHATPDVVSFDAAGGLTGAVDTSTAGRP
jgi:hypothetical protein